jgi:hypothetical protein
MATPAIVRVHENLHQSGSGRIDGTWIWQYLEGTYRTRYHSDGKPEQSYIVTELWTPAGWTEVLRQNGYDVEMPSPYRFDRAGEDLILGLLYDQQELATRIVQGW